jgi:starch phosphorylase
MQQESVNFTTAIEKARNKILFTNHTLKQAGNDLFDYTLVQEYLQPYAEEFQVNFRDVFSLGVDPIYANGKFGMSILAMNNASRINAVSEIHAEAAKKIWSDQTMTPVTNGVHLTTWVSEPFHDLFDRNISERWNEQGAKIDWNKLDDIPTEKIWSAHQDAKRTLLKHIQTNCGVNMPEESMLIGWFRRITRYKQPEVMTLDMERLERLIHRDDVDVRFVFGGKAHPKDEAAKKLLQDVWKMTKDPKFKDHIVIVPDYNWRMARYMISGTDIWMNTPIRYQEACGTSGMKAAANGVIQFSTIDGWIDEIKDTGTVFEIEDNLNPDQYYHQLEENIIPEFKDRKKWVKRMKKTMKIALTNYGTDRMIRDYLEKLYKPMLKELREF